MIAPDLVTGVLWTEIGLLALIAAAIVGHALALRVRERRQRAVLELGRRLLIEWIIDPARVPPSRWAVLRRMPRRLVLDLLAELAPSLAGQTRKAVEELAGDLGLVTLMRRYARSGRWWRRLHAARIATLIDSDPALMRTFAADRHPLVRAQAAEWMMQHAEEHNIPLLLLQMLSDRAPVVRFAARDSLMRMGRPAQIAVSLGLRNRNRPALVEVIGIASMMPTPAFLDDALAYSADARQPIRVAAVGLLRAIGGGAAAARLMAMLQDSVPAVRAAAADALGANGHWPAAGALAARLEDDAWTVRRAAAVALQRIGPPGLMLLYRARDRMGGAAADIARQVLEVTDHLGVRARA